MAVAAPPPRAPVARKPRRSYDEFDQRTYDDDVPVIHLPSPERALSPPLVAMERVQAGYPDRTVLTGLNLTLAPDDRVALLGANGNGKSTLMKSIMGIVRPSAGKITAMYGYVVPVAAK